MIGMINNAISITEPIGFALEPIATASDPEDKVEGDYLLRVSYRLAETAEEQYVSIFEASLEMERTKKLSNDGIVDMLVELLKDLIRYKASALESINKENFEVIGKNGTLDKELRQVLREAREMAFSVKH